MEMMKAGDFEGWWTTSFKYVTFTDVIVIIEVNNLLVSSFDEARGRTDV